MGEEKGIVSFATISFEQNLRCGMYVLYLGFS